MSDAMVLKTQKWLNATYGGDSRFVQVTENGNTGWNTIYGLRRALQIELGIQATSTAFGPSTTAKFKERFPNGVIQQSADDETEDNVYAIIQGALWCKGYSTGASGITKHFYSGTGGAIKELKEDAGCSSSNSSTVTLNVMKALLSMDQFVKVYGGSDTIRSIQQNINNRYEDYIGLSPCDGLYGRAMNTALIKVLQAIEGYSVEDATGNFGSGTKSKLPLIPSEGILSDEKYSEAVKLIRYALCCNGYEVPIVSGEWDSTLSATIAQFQRDMCIEYEDSKCNIDTWMALLLSKGNPDRSCVACDTRFEITPTILSFLKSCGYQIVGRYLTGGDFKELRIGEAKNIISNGLKLFPIFQESTTNLQYFTPERGALDAKNAVKAARKHGIPGDNIIYFAVDTDPVDSEITNYILPYFKAVSENMSKSFKVGVYGTRNVCTRVMNLGYAETCFVSDMSTGYSGNMGFKMPSNWNLDQFNELSNLTAGDETFDLDKVAYSGKFPVVQKVYSGILEYNIYIRQLEQLYLNYKQEKNESCTVRELILGITNFLRSFKYGDAKWYVATLTAINNEFINYVKTKNIELYDKLFEYADDDNVALTEPFGGYVDIGHLAATVEGYIAGDAVPDFWFGWGGDLASLMKQVDDEVDSEKNNYLEVAKKLFADRSNFGYADVCTDADSIKVAEILKQKITDSITGNYISTTPFSEAILEYYSQYAELRLTYYLEDLNTTLGLADLKGVILEKMAGILERFVLMSILGNFPSDESKNASCEAMAQYIIDNYPVI